MADVAAVAGFVAVIAPLMRRLVRLTSRLVRDIAAVTKSSRPAGVPPTTAAAFATVSAGADLTGWRLRAPDRGEGAEFEDDVEEEVGELVGSSGAATQGAAATTPPIPKATARAPTRPTEMNSAANMGSLS